jgi:hypothetical protein
MPKRLQVAVGRHLEGIVELADRRPGLQARVIAAALAGDSLRMRCSSLERFPPKLTHTPLVPAKAGIQSLAKELGPRFRGDERDNRAAPIQPENALAI